MRFIEWKLWFLIKISLKFIPKGLVNNIPALVQIMAWHQPGDKPLSETMMVRLLTYICITQPQWVNGHKHDDNLAWKHFLHFWHSARPWPPVYSPHKEPIMRGVDAFLSVSLNRLNKLLNKLSRGWWLEIPWRLCDVIVMRIALSVLVIAQLILPQSPILHINHVMKYCNYSQKAYIIMDTLNKD